jgi:predicted metal-dependent peptidase
MSGAAEDQEREALLRIMAARVVAQRRWPYVSALLFSLQLVPVTDGSLATMGVDSRWRLYYSPPFVVGEEVEGLATVLLHESLHCLHAHSDRYERLHLGDTYRYLWNVAADAVINAVLDGEDMPWPSVRPIRFEDLRPFGVKDTMTTEGAFHALVGTEGSSLPPSHPIVVECGSISSSGRRMYELPEWDDAFPAVPPDRQAGVLDRVAAEILDYARTPGGGVALALQRWAEDVCRPRIPWRDVLAGQLRRSLASVMGCRDYTYSRPSRRQHVFRQAGSEVVLAALRAPEPPRVAVVLDTSGSISGGVQRTFLTEVVGIAQAVGGTDGLRVICCDTEAYPAQYVKSRSDVEKMLLSGGGGTDMRVGLAEAMSLRPPPHVVVVFTDGDTPWPEESPRGAASVIVAAPRGAVQNRTIDWARWVYLDLIDG